MIEMNYNPKNKALICEAENHRGYIYYEFTEASLKFIAAKEVTSVEYSEWCSLLQTLYPNKLICSGLFESFLVFEIENGRRKDPPQDHWGNLVDPGSDGVLLERFIAALREHGIKVHESWHTVLKKKGERHGTKPTA